MILQVISDNVIPQSRCSVSIMIDKCMYLLNCDTSRFGHRHSKTKIWRIVLCLEGEGKDRNVDVVFRLCVQKCWFINGSLDYAENWLSEYLVA